MKPKIIFFLLFFIQVLSAQFQDISFSNLNWNLTPTSNINVSSNMLNVVGNTNSYSNGSRIVDVSNATSEYYFVVEIKLENVSFNTNIKNPTIVVRNNDTNALIARLNLNAGLQNSWFKTGVKIRPTDANQLKIEIGINNTTGTLFATNPILTYAEPSFSYNFPFTMPINPIVNLNVDLNQKHTFNNDLLSTNSHFVYADLQWGDSELTSLFNVKFPQSNYRFPGGTVGNHYDYLTDTFYTTSLTPNNLVNIANNGYLFKYNSYKNQVINTSGTATLMFNVLHNSVLKSKNEFISRKNSGLPIKWIELGNEMFFAENQTGANVTDEITYQNHCQNLSNEIKSIDAAAKLAICIDKDDYSNGSWNNYLSQNQTYYDACVIHNYNATQVFFPNDYYTYACFNSYRLSMDRFEKYQLSFSNKPLLLTEWGITSDKDSPFFTQTIGIADMFLAIEKANQLGVVQQAGLHMLYKNNVNSEATLVYKDAGVTKLTVNGELYSKLFEVFKNSEVFNADAISPELETGLKSVYAKMVKKGNVYKIFAVNKLPVSTPLNLRINNLIFNGSYSVETLSKDMNTVVNGAAISSTSWNNQNGSGAISIPASSIVVITINENEINALNSAIYEIEKDDFEISPIPVENILNIKSKNSTDYSYRIFDSLGNLMIDNTSGFSESQINCEYLASGMYFIEIKKINSQKSIFKKIIKK